MDVKVAVVTAVVGVRTVLKQRSFVIDSSLILCGVSAACLASFGLLLVATDRL